MISIHNPQAPAKAGAFSCRPVCAIWRMADAVILLMMVVCAVIDVAVTRALAALDDVSPRPALLCLPESSEQRLSATSRNRQIRDLHLGGASQRQIAAAVGVSQSTVQRVLSVKSR